MPKATKKPLEISIEVNDRTGEILAAYLFIREGKTDKVKEFANGNAYADYDKGGHLLGVEFLGPCEIDVLDKIAKKEPNRIKTFVRNSIPRQLALTE